METIKRIVNWVGVLFTTQNNRDWRVVVLCVIAATTFWFFNALNKNGYTTVINYPIELTYLNPDDSLIEVLPAPEEIAIDVTGRGWILFKETFWFNNDPIRINLPSPVETKYLTNSSLLPIIEQSLSELKINSLLNDTVFFSIEPRVSKKVAVFVDSVGLNIQPDHLITSAISFQPDSIVISGPSSLIETLPNRVEAFIDEDNIESDFDQEISSTLFQESILSFSPENIRIKFQVGQLTGVRTTVPIRLENFPESNIVTLSDTLVEIDYKVIDSDSNQDNPAIFEAVADYNSFNKEDSTIQVKVLNLNNVAKEFVFSPESVSLRYEE